MEVEIGWIFLNQEKNEIKAKIKNIEKQVNTKNPNLSSEERELFKKQLKLLKKYEHILDCRMKLKILKENKNGK